VVAICFRRNLCTRRDHTPGLLHYAHVNRRPFLPLALESFIVQDYPARELIVVDDGTDVVRDVVEGVAGVRYLRLPARASIGEKRNRACAAGVLEAIDFGRAELSGN
jgi:Glycosyl transferase family 2